MQCGRDFVHSAFPKFIVHLSQAGPFISIILVIIAISVNLGLERLAIKQTLVSHPNQIYEAISDHQKPIDFKG